MLLTVTSGVVVVPMRTMAQLRRASPLPTVTFSDSVFNSPFACIVICVPPAVRTPDDATMEEMVGDTLEKLYQLEICLKVHDLAAPAGKRASRASAAGS